MARKPGSTSQMRHRAAKTAAVVAPGAAVAGEATPKRKTSPGQFANEVRAEARKITWPSRKETWITSVMVFIMVLIAAAFFWIVDTGLGFASRIILSLGQ